MKELWPNFKSELRSFSASVQESLDKGDLNIQENALAKILDDGTLACISKGCSLEIVNIKNGQRQSAFNFEDMWTVSCFCSHQDKYIVCLKAQDTTQQHGMLCLYDPGVSRVVKAIKLSVVPISICLLKPFGGAGDKSNFISDVFKYMFGIVAMGTLCGHVYIIDLRNDDKEEYFPFSSPSTLLLTDPDSISNISELREQAKQSGKHCCIDISGNFCSHNVFKYTSPENDLLRLYHPGTFSVSALMYVHRAASLVVGYQFGSFHIFSMETMKLTHSSQVGSLSIPITHFAFQEPDDDPRSCCYLWVGRGPMENDSAENNNVPTSLSLYQLLFEDKQEKPEYGIFYKELECVIKRFNHQLTSDVYHLVDSHSAGSRIICLKSIGSNSTLCYIVWETPGAGKEGTCHLGIFDINRWYEKQLPGSVRDAMYGRMEAVCPFFAFYSLSDIAEGFLPNGILDVQLDSKCIGTFQSVVGPQSEYFYWPSSSMFSATCISEGSSIDIEMLGLQRQIIANVRQSGTDSFVEAQDIVQNCWMAGLVQNTVGITRAVDDKRNADAVLSIQLEHEGINFITSCVKKWSHGSITHAGHSIRMIYDWAWNQVIHVKRELDQLYIPIFQSLMEKLEPEHSDRLKRISIDLYQLAEVFRELKRVDALSTDAGQEELETREKIIAYLNKYCGILLLLINIELLPELISEPDTTPVQPSSLDGKIKYPSKVLLDYYEFRRSEVLSQCTESSENICLFVDLLSKQFVTVDKESGGDCDMEDEDKCMMRQYPPKSVEVMCRLFAENCCEDEMQVMLFYYFILDVTNCFEQYQTNQVAKKFKDTLHLSRDKSLLVESMWLLDHKLYKDAAEHLSLIESKISSRYYTHIVRTLHQVDQLNLLATFCSCKEPLDCSSFDEVKFLVQTLLRLKLLNNAYHIQSSFSNQSKKSLLFRYFVEQCKENKLLGKLVSLSLVADEEELLKLILKRSNENQDFLLLYYLERGYYSDAFNLTREIRNSGKWRRLRTSLLTTEEQNLIERKSKLMALDQLETKGLLVDGFMQTVPTIEQKRLSFIEAQLNSGQNSSTCTTDRKQPLSATYRTPNSSALNRSTDILTTLYNQSISTDVLDMSTFLECVGGGSNNRRRKSPLFDGEMVSPKKKPKEMPSVDFEQITQKHVAEPNSGRASRKYEGKDAYKLLATPPRVRRVKHVHASVNNGSNMDKMKTPQSILKSRVQGNANQNDPLKSLIIPTAETSSRKIRFIGLSPTSPLSTASPTLTTPPTESPSKEFAPLHLTYEDAVNQPAPTTQSHDHMLLELSTDTFDDATANGNDHESVDFDSMLLELSRDEESLKPIVDDSENSLENSPVADDNENLMEKSPAVEDNESPPVQTKPEVLQLSTDDEFCSFVDDEVVTENIDDSEVTGTESSSSLSIPPQQTNVPVESTCRESTVIIHDSEDNECVLHTTDDETENRAIEMLVTDDEDVDGNVGDDSVDDDGNVSDVNDIIGKQGAQSLEQMERLEYAVVVEDDGENKDSRNEDGVQYKDSVEKGDSVNRDGGEAVEKEPSVGQVHENVQEAMVSDGEEMIVTSHDDDGDDDVISVDGSHEQFHADERDTEEGFVAQDDTQDDIIRVAPLEIAVNDVIEIAETQIIPHEMKNPPPADGVATYTEERQEIVLYGDNDVSHISVEGAEIERVPEAVNADAALFDSIMSSVDPSTSATDEQEDFEIIDSFSERGSNYGDKPNLFVDESMPISSTFLENGNYSEDPMRELVELTTSNTQPDMMEQVLLGDSSTTSNPIVSLEIEGIISTALEGTPVMTPSTSMDTSAAATTRQSSRRPKTPTRIGLPERRMVTRGSTKKATDESLYETSLVAAQTIGSQLPMETELSTTENITPHSEISAVEKVSPRTSTRGKKNARNTVAEAERVEEKLAPRISKRGKKNAQKTIAETEVVNKTNSRRSSPRRKNKEQETITQTEALEELNSRASTRGVKKSVRKTTVETEPEATHRLSSRRKNITEGTIAEGTIAETEVVNKTAPRRALPRRKSNDQDTIAELEAIEETISRASTRGRKNTRRTIIPTEPETNPSSSPHKIISEQETTVEIGAAKSIVPRRMSPRRNSGQETEEMIRSSSPHMENNKKDKIEEGTVVETETANKIVSRTPTSGKKEVQETDETVPQRASPRRKNNEQEAIIGTEAVVETVPRVSTRGRKSVRKIIAETEPDKLAIPRQEPIEETQAVVKIVPLRGSPRRENNEQGTTAATEPFEEAITRASTRGRKSVRITIAETELQATRRSSPGRKKNVEIFENESIDENIPRASTRAKKNTRETLETEQEKPAISRQQTTEETRRVSSRRKNVGQEAIVETEPVEETIPGKLTRSKKNPQETIEETEAIARIVSRRASPRRNNFGQEAITETEVVAKTAPRTPTRGKKNAQETIEETGAVPKAVSRTPTRGKKNAQETIEETEAVRKAVSRTPTREKKNTQETLEHVDALTQPPSPPSPKRTTRGRSPSRKKTTSSNEPLILNTFQVADEQLSQVSLTSLIQKTNESSADDTVATRTRRKSGARQEVNRDLSETSFGAVMKTRTQKTKVKLGNKPDATNDSVLSFDKNETIAEPPDLASTPFSVTTPTRTSQRSSSKRASIAITADLQTSRKSSRIKKI